MDAKGAVRWVMEHEGVSGVEASRRLGLSRGYVGKALGGNGDIMAGTLARIAAALGWSLVLKRGPVEVDITG